MKEDWRVHHGRPSDPINVTSRLDTMQACSDSLPQLISSLMAALVQPRPHSSPRVDVVALCLLQILGVRLCLTRRLFCIYHHASDDSTKDPATDSPQALA